MSQLPSDYTNEIDSLNREVLEHQPSDLLQFCANYFFRRLESERADHVREQRRTTTDRSSPQARALTSAAGASSAPMSGAGMHSLREEDEEGPGGPALSPTARVDDTEPRSSGSGRSSSANPFGNFGGFGSSFGGSDQMHSAMPSNYNTNRRTSVSAEVLSPSADTSDFKPPYHPKTSEQEKRLRAAVANNFLFSHLHDEQSAQVLGALVEKPVPAKGIKVISQGDVGDYFYIVENGSFDIYVNPSGKIEPGADGMGNKVSSIGPGGSFGELALMYNAPRAATVVSTEPSTLWALDRVTFRRILMDSAFQRRRMYEAFLEEVDLLSSLTSYERSKIADALDTRKYPAGEYIIREGEPGQEFFMIESGEAEVYKGGNAEPIHKYNKGGYFGELALLNDAPRAASVVAKTDVKVACLGKEGFQRLMGPVEGIMRRNDPSKKAGVETEPPSRGQ